MASYSFIDSGSRFYLPIITYHYGIGTWDGSYTALNGTVPTTYYAFDSSTKGALGGSANFTAAIKAWDDVSSTLTFSSTSSSAANYIIYSADTGGITNPIPFPNFGAAGGVTYALNNDGTSYTSAETAMRNDYPVSAPDSNDLRYTAAIHEIGHALGLQHPGFNNPRDADYDTDKTVMSYNNLSHRPITPMPYDIWAIQAKYGLGSVHAEDNSYYGPGVFNGMARSQTIVDTGGNHDIFDMTFISGNHRIDLREAIAGDGSWRNAPTIVNGTEYVYIAKGSIIEDAQGWTGNDTIIGNGNANRINGGDGNDLIISNALDSRVDTLSGGAGNDTIWAGALDSVDPGTGSDYIYLNGSTFNQQPMDGGDTIVAYSGDSTISMTDPGSTLVINPGATVHADFASPSTGGGSADHIHLYLGNQNVQLPSPYLYSGPWSPDGISWDLGSGYHAEFKNYSGVANNILTITSGSLTVLAATHVGGANFGMGVHNSNLEIPYSPIGSIGSVSAVTKPGFVDQYDPQDTAGGGGGGGSGGGSAGNVINGTSGADSLPGTAAADSISGLAGNDTLSGGDGADTLDGGAGKDGLTGGLGNDVFKFTSLTDSNSTVAGSAYDRIADFVEGTDKVDVTGLGFTSFTTSTTATTAATQLRDYYDSPNDRTYVTNDQTHFLFYLAGNHLSALHADSFIFNAAPSYLTLTGTASAETLTGTNASTLIQGLDGNDTLIGGTAADTLVGGLGKDSLTGGGGADVFKFGALGDSSSSTGLFDRINDFVDGTDKLDVHGLGFASVTTSTTATTNATQLRIYYDSPNSRTYVTNDQTHFLFYLAGDHTATLHQDSFLL